MGQEKRIRLTPQQHRELWDRWKAGESLSDIGRALGRVSASRQHVGGPRRRSVTPARHLRRIKAPAPPKSAGQGPQNGPKKPTGVSRCERQLYLGSYAPKRVPSKN